MWDRQVVHMRRLIPLVIGVLCLIGFALLSKFEDRDALRRLDFAVTVKVQESIDNSSHLRVAALVGNIMEGATFFASPGFTVAVVMAITAAAAYDRKQKRIRFRAAVIPLALFVLVLIEIVGKSIVHHPSPPFGMIKNPESMFPADYINEQYSYPSGHAARAAFMALVLFALAELRGFWQGRRNPVRWGVALLSLACVATVSLSRIYLGHHWFSDVAGGLLIGLGTGSIAASVLLLHASRPRQA